MKYYKMIRRYTNGATGETYLTSLSCFRGKWTVKYPVNEWVYPNYLSTKLFVFNSLQPFQDYYVEPGYEVYECQVKNPIEIPNNIKRIPVYNQQLESFWDNQTKFQQQAYCMSMPKHTVWCDAVKLLKKISIDYLRYSTI